MGLYNYFEFIVVLIYALRTIYSYIRKCQTINIYWISYAVFNIFFIYPLLIFDLYGTLRLDLYAGFKYIKNHYDVDLIYLIIVLFIAEVLRYVAIKRTSTKGFFRLVELSNFVIKDSTVYILFILTFLPILSALLAPQPDLYFMSIAPFYRQQHFSITENDLNWHKYIMSISLYLSFIGIIPLWIKVQANQIRYNALLWNIYLIFSSIVILLFSNKRTLGILVILALLTIKFIVKKRINKLQFLSVTIFCLSYFVFYQIYTGKPMMGGGVYSGWVEHYAIYLTRVIDFKLVISSIINPELFQILEFKGQSIIFDLLAFVPRTLWPDKPYPFGAYLTAAWKGTTVYNVDSNILTSFFAELLANFSWLGIPLSVYLYIKLMDITEWFSNPLIKMFAYFNCIYFMITMVGSNHFTYLLLFILYFIFEKKKLFSFRL